MNFDFVNLILIFHFISHFSNMIFVLILKTCVFKILIIHLIMLTITQISKTLCNKHSQKRFPFQEKEKYKSN